MEKQLCFLYFLATAAAMLPVAAARAEVAEAAPGVYFRLGDIDRGQSNGGYVVCDSFVAAIDAPNAEASAEMLAEVAELTGKPVKYLVITHGHWDHDRGMDVFAQAGVVVVAHEQLRQLYAQQKKEGTFIGVSDRLTLGEGGRRIEIFTHGTAHSPTDLFVYLPDEGVLFTGDAVVSTTSSWFGDSNVENWIQTCRKLAALDVKVVCPGHGPMGGPELIAAFSDYLVKLRDEVAYQVSMGRPIEMTLQNVDVPEQAAFCREGGFPDQVKAVYGQLTAAPAIDGPRAQPRALVLIGDHYHPPAYIRPPLEDVFERLGMPAEFVYDVTKLTAESLRNVSLLVVLRDGMVWPDDDKNARWWMSAQQVEALAEFVSGGGGYLALHNSTALQRLGPEATAYRDLLGSSYNGHGAGDERFAVRVVELDHPVTRGVTGFDAVDERHRPVMHAEDAVILLEAGPAGQAAVNGYVRQVGGGRVCHLANGHNREVLENAQMQKLLENAMLWCCGLER